MPSVVRGDCRKVLPHLPPDTFDCSVTDPPYELKFMGREWDGTGVAFDPATWEAVYRVLKPGAFLLAFGGTRTYHRMACAIEDAGFEVRDQIGWLYGTGFPKSLDVSKAIDHIRDDWGDVRAVTAFVAAGRDAAGRTNAEIDAHFDTNGMAGHWTTKASQPAVPTWENWLRLRDFLNLTGDMDAEVWRLNGRKGTPGNERADRVTTEPDANKVFQPSQRVVHAGTPVTAAAADWQGWGTALKPAWEPIVVARKPLAGTVAANVLAWGTGGLNIDACRMPTTDDISTTRYTALGRMNDDGWKPKAMDAPGNPLGRWPANIIHDGSDEVIESFGGEGGAARFFYCAKASKAERERDGNDHATVKPLALMQWLVRLVCRRGGRILDPFAGSGTTLEAADLEGMDAYGIEERADHCRIIARRMARAMSGD